MPLTSSTFHPFQNHGASSSRSPLLTRNQSSNRGHFLSAALRTTPSGNTPIPFSTGLLDRLRTPITRYHE